MDKVKYTSNTWIMSYENINQTPAGIYKILKEALETKKRFLTIFYCSVKEGTGLIFFKLSTNITLNRPKLLSISGKIPSFKAPWSLGHENFLKELVESDNFFDYNNSFQKFMGEKFISLKSKDASKDLFVVGFKRACTQKLLKSDPETVKKTKTQDDVEEVSDGEELKIVYEKKKEEIKETENILNRLDKMEDRLLEKVSEFVREECNRVIQRNELICKESDRSNQRNLAPAFEMLQNLTTMIACPTEAVKYESII